MDPWARAKNLLCVRLSGMGGVLTATPAIRALRQSVPGRRVTLLSSKPGARVGRQVPEIDAPLGYDAPWRDRDMEPGAIAALGMRYALEMHGFDAAVVFTRALESPLPAARLCRVAGIEHVAAHCVEDPDGLVTHRFVEPDAAQHDARRQLDLAAALGAATDDECLSYRVRPRDAWCARMKLEESGIDVKRELVVVHPGAEPALPPEEIGAALAELVVAFDTQVVVTGTAAEREVAEAVRRAAGDRARSLAGSLRLEELAGVLELAPLLVATHGPVIHLAAAVGTPVVDIGAPEQSPEVPWMVAHRVLPAGPGLHTAALVERACDLWLDIHWRAAA